MDYASGSALVAMSIWQGDQHFWHDPAHDSEWPREVQVCSLSHGVTYSQLQCMLQLAGKGLVLVTTTGEDEEYIESSPHVPGFLRDAHE